MPNPADTLTLADLKNWNRRDQAGNFLPSLAVLGHPVAHSVSPQMHNAALAELAKAHPQLRDWCYFKFDIAPEELEESLKILPQKGFVGVNLTVPHKTSPVVLIHADIHDRRLLAINTLIGGDNGWLGINSDGYGLIQSLNRDLKIDLRKGAEVVVLGAGGAARSAVMACWREGCGKIWIGNRTLEKLKPLLDVFSKLKPPSNPYPLEGFDISTPPSKEWSANAVVINATTVGLKPNDGSPLDVSLLGRYAVVLDMIYRRDGITPLVAGARACGLRATDGLGMLVWQGAFSLTVWLQNVAKIRPESIAPTMMTAACAALGIPPRHA